MTPPGALWRVEWSAARRFTTPNDRTDQSRNFSTAAGAARQVAAILAWPTHMELRGVWETVGHEAGRIEWMELDVSDLPALDIATQARMAALVYGRTTHPDPEVRATVEGDDV